MTPPGVSAFRTSRARAISALEDDSQPTPLRMVISVVDLIAALWRALQIVGEFR